ncbi:1213_t:CDS:2 [Gigaspora margarita]|uniref:1213_t:CDS:1 n=1 Tax=Gigaspora margarita TaxID=4874 RepID=A0ABN7URJ9_GIGMA|nr:1213_t:CDS:2 [Gigaspora margarita]
MIYDIINDQPVISYSYIKDDLPVPDIQFFSENMFVMTCGFGFPELQKINMIYDRDCNSYITDPLEKDGSYYNGYFSIPFENSYKLSLSNNTKYGKRGEQIGFLLQILDLNVNASYFIQISDSGDNAIQPFGLIQKRGYFYERTQKKLIKFLSTFPLVQLSDLSNNIDDDESRVNHLERKINQLELFLRDYVVDVQQLDKAYKNTENAKDK